MTLRWRVATETVAATAASLCQTRGSPSARDRKVDGSIPDSYNPPSSRYESAPLDFGRFASGEMALASKKATGSDIACGAGLAGYLEALDGHDLRPISSAKA